MSRLAQLTTASSLVLALLSAAATPAFARRVSPHPYPSVAPVQFAQPPDGMPRPAHEDLPMITLDRATVRSALIKARTENVARFRAYQQAGVFPSNTYRGSKLNVWQDEAGHFCAAATIIRASGATELVDRVAEQNNFIRLGDQKQGPLMDWILTSGLTQEEIAAIQEPFMPVVEPTTAKVDPALRKTEDARLRARYRVVDKMIAKNQKRSLDVAVTRLMNHPNLAWKLVYGG